MLAEYNVFRGKTWPLDLLFIALAPLGAVLWRMRASRREEPEAIVR